MKFFINYATIVIITLQKGVSVPQGRELFNRRDWSHLSEGVPMSTTRLSSEEGPHPVSVGPVASGVVRDVGRGRDGSE